VSSSSRLERALTIWMQAAANGTTADVVLGAHPDLHDLLQPLLQPEAIAAEPPVETIGDFELRRVVGRGGMGVVHEARQRSLGRRVALKVLAEHVAVDPARIARFRREASTLARLEHPNVVRVFDAGEDDGRHWLAMEFVDGVSLDQRLQQLVAEGGHHDGSLRELVVVVQKVAAALAHVHQAGLLHRDVKPSNVLLTADGRAFLSDFGLARPVTGAPLTQEGMLAGTPHYLAPEYVTTGTASAAGDVWSLGATLYEAITLVRPFDGARDDVVLQRIVQQDPLDPRRHRPELPPDLVAITLRALEKDPALRYPDMHAFAADLQAFLDLRPTVARPPTRARRLQRWLRREPLRAALAATALLAVALGAFVLLRLPVLRAGERAAAASAYEEAITTAFLRRGEGDGSLAGAAAATALELRPDTGEAMVVSALVTLRHRGPGPALAELQRLRLAPHDDDEACAWLQVLLLGRLGQVAAATELAQALGEPRSQMAMLMAAGVLVDAKTPAKIEAARALASQATRLGPPRLLVHAQWAALLDPRDRAECAAVLLRLWPDQPFALHLAATHLQKLEPARALALQQRAVALGLQDPWAHYNVAMYASQAGDHALAVATALSVLAQQALPEERRRALLQVVEDAAPERYEAAVAAWRTQAPDDWAARREQGLFWQRRGEVERAHDELAAVLAALPDDPRALQGLALAKQQRGEPAASVPLIDRLVALVPTLPAGHFLRMHALRSTAAPTSALLAELRRASVVVPAEVDVWRDLAATLLATGEAQHHAESLRAAMQADLRDDGEDPETLRVLLAAHEAAGEATSAALVRARLAALAPR
jgi:tetratricopeptide (TPR) repeat protein/predicted Ser/Thr protein kinase